VEVFFMNAQEQGTATNAQGQGASTEQKGDGALDNFGTQGQQEGGVAKMIEQQTAKLPSDWFLWAAIGGMGVSAALELAGYKNKSRFFGQWVAPFLLFGVYNKLVKQHGSDKTETVH
jgi:hypothetical protein